MIHASIAEWRHGLVNCPVAGCRSTRTTTTSRICTLWRGPSRTARSWHRRCGAHFEIEFGSGPRQ